MDKPGTNLPPLDQFSQPPKPASKDSLPPLTKNSLNANVYRASDSSMPVQALGSSGSEFVSDMADPKLDPINKKGDAEFPLTDQKLHSDEEQLNGKSTDLDELDDFFGKPLPDSIESR